MFDPEEYDGFALSEAQEWYRNGFESSFEADPWRDAAFSPQEAAAWSAAADQFRDWPESAAEWRARGFPPRDAARCLAAGWEDISGLEALQDSGYTVEALVEFAEAGLTAWAIFRLEDWIAAGFTREESRAWEAVGWDGDDLGPARRWRDAGLTPQQGAAWLKAGWLESQLDEARHWLKAGFTTEEATAWAKSESLELADAAQWRDAGFSASEANRWLSSGWRTSQVQEAATWRARGVNSQEAFMSSFVGLSAEDPEHVGGDTDDQDDEPESDDLTNAAHDTECWSCRAPVLPGSRFCSACGTSLSRPTPPIKVAVQRFRETQLELHQALQSVTPPTCLEPLKALLDRASLGRGWYDIDHDKAVAIAEKLAAEGHVEAAYLAQGVEALLAAALSYVYWRDAMPSGKAGELGNMNLRIDGALGCLAVVRVLRAGTTTSLSATAIEARCRTYGVRRDEALAFAQDLARNLGCRRPRRLSKADRQLLAPLLAWISGGKEP